MKLVSERMRFEREGTPIEKMGIGSERDDLSPKELFDAMYRETLNSEGLSFAKSEINWKNREPMLKIESKELALSNNHDWVQKTFTFYLTEDGIVGFTEWNYDEVEIKSLKQFINLTGSRRVPKQIKEAQHFQQRRTFGYSSSW